MFFQDVTPDTSGYMIAGYLISFLVMGLYVASIYLRARSLRQDQSLLEEMDQESKLAAEQRRPASPAGEKKYTPVTKNSTQK